MFNKQQRDAIYIAAFRRHLVLRQELRQLRDETSWAYDVERAPASPFPIRRWEEQITTQGRAFLKRLLIGPN